MTGKQQSRRPLRWFRRDVAWKAFEIMQRRGWHVRQASTGEWVVYAGALDGRTGLAITMIKEDEDGKVFCDRDPFLALILADEWHKEHFEGNDHAD